MTATKLWPVSKHFEINQTPGTSCLKNIKHVTLVFSFSYLEFDSAPTDTNKEKHAPKSGHRVTNLNSLFGEQGLGKPLL